MTIFWINAWDLKVNDTGGKGLFGPFCLEGLMFK